MSHKTLCGAIQSKIWGVTQCIFEGPFSEMHLARSISKGFCSEHRHNAKWNRFFVIRGKIKVTIFKSDTKDETIVTDGQYTDVPPSQWHVFECLEDTEFIEVYWVDPLDSSDIERRTNGGIKP